MDFDLRFSIAVTFRVGLTFGGQYGDFGVECQRRMRYKAAMKRVGMAAGLILLACAGCSGPPGVEIPRHDTRNGPAGGFRMGRCEVTVREFADYLNAERVAGYPGGAQIERRGGGRYAVRRGAGRQAVAEVTPAEAEAYCRWLSGRLGRTVRLPAEAEWEAAARGGVDGAPYPWGWGGNPARLARFDAPGPAPRAGVYPANGFGLRDTAGNVYEWCAPASGDPLGVRAARGGAWPERDPSRLRVDRRQVFPADYRGRDAGFRVLIEAKEPAGRVP